MQDIKLFHTNSFECGYFSELTASYLLLDPGVKPDSQLQEHLAGKGYRRSGNNLYYPWCNGCKKCIPIRIRLDNFKPNQAQKRCLKKNLNTKVSINVPEINQGIFELYKNYQTWRHPDGGMDDCKDFSTMDFLTSSWSNTKFIHLLNKDKLFGMAVVDFYENSISAAYTFYAKSHAHLSPGTFAVLWQINHAKKLGLEYLYLGYYIKDTRKMSYKINFKPYELLVDNNWRQFEQ